MQTFIKAKEVEMLYASIIIDCRFDLTDTNAGYESYLEGHIPGASYAHLDNDLSGPITEKSGRHPLPEVNHFISWLSIQGIDPTFPIIVYDSHGGGIAARLWFMLLQLGYPQVYILEGGFPAWLTASLPILSGEEFRDPITLDSLNRDWSLGPIILRSTAEVAELKVGLVVDSRAPERYLGDEEPLDPIAGRIPSAINIPWMDNLDLDQMLLPLTDLQQRFEVISRAHTFYCGSGVTAIVNIAVMTHLDMVIPAFYPGSYSEWIAQNPTDVERG